MVSLCEFLVPDHSLNSRAYSFGYVKLQCGWQVLVGKPGDLHVPPSGKGESLTHWVDCKDVAGAWWLKSCAQPFYRYALFYTRISN